MGKITTIQTFVGRRDCIPMMRHGILSGRDDGRIAENQTEDQGQVTMRAANTMKHALQELNRDESDP
mgnify:CR=1 FL=1